MSNTTYITTPQTTIILPMDRSMPPEISRMLIAIVRIPNTQIWLENCDNVIDANKIRVDTRNNYDNQCDNDCQKDPLLLKNIFSRRKASLFISHLYLLPMHV